MFKSWLARCGLIGLAAATIISGTIQTAGAATTPPVPKTISIGGHSYLTGPLLAAKNYAVMNATTAQISVLPEAKAALPASTYSELASLVSSLNVADSELRASTAGAVAQVPAQAPSAVARASSSCIRKFHYSWGRPLNIYIPDCMAYGFAAAVGGPAAVVAFLFSEIGPLEWAAAVVIASAIVASQGLLTAWAGVCDIFGPGNGVRFTWTWTRGIGSPYGYPTFGCW